MPEVAVTLSGLIPNSEYTVSFSHYNAGSGTTIHSHYEGTVATGTLLGEFRSGGNPAVNFAAWTPTVDYSLISDGDGEIFVTIIPTGAAVNERITLDGIGVTFAGTPPPPVPFEITEITLPEAGKVALTWTSRPGVSYIAKFSSTMADGWGSDVGDNITSELDENLDDGDQITVTFDLSEVDLQNESDLFFRIEETPPAP